MNAITHKRKNRGYKMTDADYKKAMRRSSKEKFPLANFIETVSKAYGEGADVTVNGVTVKKWFEEMAMCTRSY